METYSDLMNRLDLVVTSPDKRIRSRLHRDTFDIVFKEATYRKYGEANLAHQLGSLLQLMWTGFRKADLMAKSRTLGDAVAEESRNPSSRAGRELFRRRQELALNGTSARRHLKVDCVGWRNWKVGVSSGTLRELSEAEFCDEVRSMVSALMHDYHRKLQPLLEEFHRESDPEGYQWVREETRRARREHAFTSTGKEER